MGGKALKTRSKGNKGAGRPEKPCSIDGCQGNAHRSAKGARGYCGAHYWRLSKHGDPLGGGPCRAKPGEPQRFIQEVALQHTSDDCLIWPFGKSRDGYGMVLIDGKKVVASRYVCERAHGAPPTPEHEAAHSCGKGHLGCIAAGHLDWKTRADNQADRLLHGTHSRGERSYGAKLTEADVREINKLKGVERQRKLAARFGVSPATVSHIHNGRIWAWLSQGETA
jgi:hypothetical protein